MMPYLLSLGVGLLVGVIYGLLTVKSPAPPVIALIGLLGMLGGEAAVSYLRGHADVAAAVLHRKSFTTDKLADPAPKRIRSVIATIYHDRSRR